VLYFWAGSEGENEYGPQPPRSPVGLIVVAVASFAPFFFGLLFMVPRDKSDDVWQANCNFIVHQEWNGTTFSNGEICWEAAEMHFEEYRGERNNLGEGHSSGCKLVKTSFPLSLMLFAIDAR
jgi:hypothetical protein